MLALERRTGESVAIGGDGENVYLGRLRVFVLSVDRGKVVLGFEGGSELPILRDEKTPAPVGRLPKHAPSGQPLQPSRRRRLTP
jgi:sRNA-binding carbon storage regulator CsrA